MSKLTPVLSAHWDEKDSFTIEAYTRHGGYSASKKALTMDPDAVIQMVKDSGLRGRGGAGFPTGMKWGFIPQGDNKDHYLVVNADESEPGTCKDTPLLLANPHVLIEGCIIACHAIRAKRAFIYIRGEVTHVVRRVNAAIADAYKAGHLGNGIDVTLHIGAGAYICGEETALLESLEGKKGQPRFKPPFPANFGLYGKPTTINNTETFAAVPFILAIGSDAYLKLGKPNNGGTKIFSVSGDVTYPGNYEVPLGTPFAELLKLAGGMRHGKQLKAVIPGGSSAPVLPAKMMMDLTMDYDAISKAGSMLGSGAVIVMDETRCMVRSLLRLSYFYHEESCGQCTPCREGTGWMNRVLKRIVAGDGRMEDLQLLIDVAGRIEGHTICALGDAAAMPVRSFVKQFREEFEHYIEHGCSILAKHSSAA